MIWAAFLMGLVGSLHCAAMCGPLMLGLATKNYKLFAYLVHHLGRWIGYMILGVLFYAVVSPLRIFELQQYIALVSGVFLILFGLKSYIGPVGRFLERISNGVSRLMSSGSYGRTGNIFMGVLNGFLPCGLSFAAAGLAVNEPTVYEAMLFMLVFGIGTLPMLLGISLLPKMGKSEWVSRLNAWIPKLLVIAGFLLIIRSAGLGIPYLSPTFNPQTEQAECCE